jgi:NADPH-dependent curcumin reductase CurA
MTEETARRIVLASRPKGKVAASDFRLEEGPIPTPGPGEMLLRVTYMSLDPYMRGRMDDARSYVPPTAIGEVMTAEGVATVIESHDPDYAAGDIVLARTGWRTHAVSNGEGVRRLDPAFAPVSTALGVLGMPGFTAWTGLFKIGKPVAGETLVVGAASGPVGSLVGQLARHAGLRAVGIAGGPAKRLYRSSCPRHAGPSGRGLSQGGRYLFRECRRRGVAGGIAAAQHLRARAGLRPDRQLQRRAGAGR